MSTVDVSRRSFADRLKSDFTTVAWALIPVGIAINLIGRFTIQVLNLPLFLDTIGTVLVALLAGPWVAAVTGILTNIVIGLTMNPTSFPFGIVNAAVGIVAGIMAGRGFLQTFPKAIVMALALTVTTIVTASPIIIIMFGGVQGTGIDLVTGVLVATGRRMIEAVIGSALLIQPADKFLTLIVAYFLVKGVPPRYRPAFASKVFLPQTEQD